MMQLHCSRKVSLALLSGALLLVSTGSVTAETGETTPEADGIEADVLYAQQPMPEDDEDEPADEDEEPVEDPLPPGEQPAPPPGEPEEPAEPDIDEPDEPEVDEPEDVLAERERRGDEFFARIRPGVWAPWVRGDVTTDDQQAEFDLHPGDTIADFDLGWTLGLEVGFDEFGVLADVLWLDVDEEDVATDEDFEEADAELSKFVTNASVAWTAPLDGFGHVGPHAGVRYTYVDSGLETVDEEDDQQTLEASEGWVDPIVGVTGRIDPEGIIYIPYYADIGGIVAGSEFSWQARAALGVKLHEMMGVEFGYRHLDIDYEGEELDYDVTTSGPTLDVTATF